MRRVEATYWSADAGYNRDEYLNICWVLRDLQADRVFPMNHAIARRLMRPADVARAHRSRCTTARFIRAIRTPKTNKRTEGAALDSRHHRRTRGGYQRGGNIESEASAAWRVCWVEAVRGFIRAATSSMSIPATNVSGSIVRARSGIGARSALLNSVRLQPGELCCIQFAVIARHTIFHRAEPSAFWPARRRQA